MKTRTLRPTTAVAAGLAVALLAFTAQPVAATPPPEPVRMLGLGDSYSSGESLFDLEGACARSPGAYAPHAAGLPEMDEYVEEPIDFYACTGARSHAAPDTPSDLPDQLDTVRRAGTRYGLVTMTIGGNDLGFDKVMTGCLVGRLKIWSYPDGTCSVTEAELNARVDRLGARLPEIYDRVADTALDDGGRLLVLGYPRLFEDPATWTIFEQQAESCGAFHMEDAVMFRRVADRLNTTIRKAVERAIHPGVEYVAVSPGFEGHNLCGKEEWINGLTTIVDYNTHTGGGRKEVAVHPNYLGHRYEAGLLARAVANFDWSTHGKPTTPPPTVTPEPPDRGPGEPNEICREASHQRVCVHTDILTGSDDSAGMGHGHYAAPRTMYVGSNLVLKGLKWEAWGKATARGRGWTDSTDCDPNCGDGQQERQDVEVEISKLVDTQDLRVYTCARARKAGEGWESLGTGPERVCLDVEGKPVGGGE